VEFIGLAIAALAWFLLHAAVAGSGLRAVLVRRFGDKAYRGGFSLASVASLWWLVAEYRGAPFRPLAVVPWPLGFVPLLVVPLALVFLVGAFTVPSPTAVGGEKHLIGAEPARGLLRVTRHPFLWSVVLWSTAHLLVNFDVGSLLLFGSLGATALWLLRYRSQAPPQQSDRVWSLRGHDLQRAVRGPARRTKPPGSV
jgi:uncharacterized membrane protein